MKGNTDKGLRKAIEAYGDSVWRLVLVMTRSHHVADDVFQETFAKLYVSQKNFESGEHLKNWLLKVAGNQCRTLFRTRRLRGEVPFDIRHHDVASSDDAFDDIEVSDRLDKALAVLNADEREVVYLRAVEDMTTKEIAEVLGCPHATVRTRLRRARGKVIKQYREEGLR